MPSFSNHMYIKFQVKSRIQSQDKMFRNVRRTCWNKYVNELEQKLNERILPPVHCSKKDIDMLANMVRFVITKSYEAACLMQRSLRKKDNIWWNSEQASIQKEAHRAWRKVTKTKKTGRLKNSPYSKKLSEEQSAIHGIALKRT